MDVWIIHMAIYFALYILGAYATTDIIRLTKSGTLSVGNPDCYCPKCNRKIPIKEQLPIISYVVSKGRCRGCKEPIPPGDIFFEIFIFGVLAFGVTILEFSWAGFFFCLLFYEAVKLCCIGIMGRRKNGFAHNLLISLRNNAVWFLLLFILFGLKHIVLTGV